MNNRIQSPSIRLFRSLACGCAVVWAVWHGGAARADSASSNAVPVTRSITLSECIERTLSKNFDIRLQRINPAIQRWDIVFQQGVFDPILSGNASYQETASPLLSGARTTKQTVNELDLGAKLAGILPTGTGYGLSASDARDSGSLTTNFLYTGETAITLTQPILKNFGLSVNTAQIRVARKNYRISQQQFSLQVINSISSVINAYNELIYAIEFHKSTLEDLDEAKKLLDEDRNRVQIGVLTHLDVVQAEAGVAQRVSAEIAAGRTIRDNANALVLLISQDVSEFRGSSLIPVDYPQVEPMDSNLTNHIRTALATRPDFLAAIQTLERNDILVKFNRNQLWPEIDLQGSYGLNGAGTKFDGFSDRIGSGDYPIWSAGVVVSFPLGNRQARANYQIARLQSEQSLVSLKQLEQQILVNVDNAVGHVMTNLKLMDATHAATVLAEQSFQAELEKLRAGTSTSFLVLQAQSQLADARAAEIRARADYAESVAALAQAEGSTLQKYGIQLDQNL